MIVHKDGEQFTVNTTCEEIDVILYFPKLHTKTVSQGSMTDKGKELIEQAREVQLKERGSILKDIDISNYVNNKNQKDLDSFLSTRHKSQNGESHLSVSPAYKNTIVDFREDRLSEADRDRKWKEYLTDSEGLGIIIDDKKGVSEKLKQAILKTDIESPRTFEDLLSNFYSVGKKETEGKLYYELSWEFIEAIAKRMADNKGDKYPLFNWKKNIDVEELKQAINRHHIEVMKGNYNDGDDFLGHIVSYATNGMMLWEQLNKNK